MATQVSLLSGAVASAGSLLLQTNGTTTQATIDTSGNLGLGVTPSAWGLGKAFEVGTVGNAVWSIGAADVRLTSNVYYSGGAYKYATTNTASILLMPNDGTLQFSNAASGTANTNISFTNRLTLDASGNLLINEASNVLGKLEVAVNDNSSTQYGINIRGTGNGAYGSYLSWSDTWSGDSYRGAIAAVLGYRLDVGKGALRFFTANSSTLNEVGRFDSSGNLLVGTTTGTINTSNFGFTVASSGYTNLSRNVAGAAAVFSAFGNAGEFRVYGNGTYATVSDARIKENVINATPKLQDLMSVRIVNYNIIGDNQKQLGVIAQELAEVFPSLVDNGESEEDTKAVRYSVFIPILIKALQEQQAIITSQAAAITQLQADVEALKAPK